MRHDDKIIDREMLNKKMKDENLLSEAIKAAKTYRKLSIEKARYSLKNLLKEEKLPLQPLVNLNHLPLDEFVDAVLEQSREAEEAPFGYNRMGLPYLNRAHLKKKDGEITERGRFGMYGEVDDEEFEIDDDVIEFPDIESMVDYAMDDDEDETDDPEKRKCYMYQCPKDNKKFSDEVIDERVRMNQSILSRTPTSAPILVSSGVGIVKISDRERRILMKNLNKKFIVKKNHQIKEGKDDTDLVKRRAGIKNAGNAKQAVHDLLIKEKLK